MYGESHHDSAKTIQRDQKQSRDKKQMVYLIPNMTKEHFLFPMSLPTTNIFWFICNKKYSLLNIIVNYANMQFINVTLKRLLMILFITHIICFLNSSR